MAHKSTNGLNQPKTSCLSEIVCILYGFFTCVLALFGIVILTLGRFFISAIAIPSSDTKTTLLYVGYYEGVGIQIAGISVDFTFKFLTWDTLPLTGYGIVFFMCYSYSAMYSVLLCYGIHKRSPNCLKEYLVYGVPVTAFMLLAFFYLFAWFTEYRFYSVIAGATALYVHLVISRMVKKSHRLSCAEQNHCMELQRSENDI